ncbi:MAG: carboxypeptidase regulatory-like domain-containing protein, partial [Bacteroidota bacterium]
MKTLITRSIATLLLIMGLAITSYAQTTITESFDGASFPPTGWATSSTSALAWSGVTTGNFPTCSPHSGAGMAKCNSFSVSSGTAILVTPMLDYSHAPTHAVSFWMYRDNGYITYADRIEVFVNTTNTTSGGTSLGVINRSINLAPTVPANGWYQYSFNIPGTFNGVTNYIIFAGITTYGNNMYLDDVVYDTYIPVPGSANIVSPANGATGVLPTATLNWTAPSTGGPALGYKLYFGTNTPPTNLVNGTNLGNVTTYNPSPDLTFNVVHYWKVVPYNATGDATGAPIWSFRTLADTIMGYVSNGITGVPMVGVNVTANPGGNTTTTGDDGTYYLPINAGTYDVVFSKVGFQNVTVLAQTVVTGTATVVDAEMYENAVAPAVVTALVNPLDTQCDVTWTAPFGP